MYNELLVKDSLRNHCENGEITGVEVKIKIGYYRGVALSLFQDATLEIDGTLYTKDQLRFAVPEGTFTFDEMATITTINWNFGEAGTLIVNKPGGLPVGSTHEVEMMHNIRVFYYEYPIIGRQKRTMTVKE